MSRVWMQVFQTTATSTPESDVDPLMEQTAAEIGTKIDAELMGAVIYLR